MGSTRLPGKVLLPLGGRSVLANVLLRLRRASTVDAVLCATTVDASDDAVEDEAQANGVEVYRGSPSDVLDRYYRAAEAAGADVVVRITSDCPLLDPEVVDAAVNERRATGADYASNAQIRTFPRGLDVEAFTFDALARAHRDARESYEREHVTPYLYRHPELFRTHDVVRDGEDLSSMRWTLDTTDDLRMLAALVDSFAPVDPVVLTSDALATRVRDLGLSALNAHVPQKRFGE